MQLLLSLLLAHYLLIEQLLLEQLLLINPEKKNVFDPKNKRAERNHTETRWAAVHFPGEPTTALISCTDIYMVVYLYLRFFPLNLSNLFRPDELLSPTSLSRNSLSFLLVSEHRL